MPQIIVKGMTENQLKTISESLITQLSVVMECPKSHLMLEWIPTHYIQHSEALVYPLVEVIWFERGRDIRIKSARIITDLIQSMDYPDVEVYFTPLEKENYFENGTPFA